MKQKSGFTLVELLIVIGILAVLTTATVLLLNPVEFLKQSRDATRVSDLRAIHDALNLNQFNNPGALGATDVVYVSLASATSPNCDPSLPLVPSDWSYNCEIEIDYRKVDGDGWIPVDFTLVSTTPPLNVLPVDPINTAASGLYYTFTTGSWELNAVFESDKYLAYMIDDGGDTDLLYELGTNLTNVPAVINDRAGSGAASSPAVATSTASNTTLSTATLNGSANPNGIDATGWFRYDTTSPGTCNDTFGTRVPSAGGSALGSGTSAVAYSQDVSGLTASTTYYFCAIAENSLGKSFGSVLSFTTQAPPGRYWVGGTGNWSDTTHWSSSSGGAGGATVPTASDDVYFDANSGIGTATVDVSASSRDLNFTGYTGTFAGASTLNIGGSLTMGAGMIRTYTAAITFSATTPGKTLTFNGITMPSATTFNGAGGGWTIQDAWNNGSASINLTAGTLNTNGQTIITGTFISSNSNTRSLILGSSSITCSSAGTAWSFATIANLTLDAGTSLITFTGASPTFNSGGKTYYDVNFPSAGTATIYGANTFHNLNRTGTAVTTDRITFVGNQTITGTLTITGNSAINRIFVLSSATGTTRTLTAAAVLLANVDFQDIAGAGAAVPFGGTSLGDAGGNTGITTNTPTTRYWVGGTGSWSSTGEWSISSGGASGASVPLPQDDVIFDVNSFSTAGLTVTANMPRLGKNINWTGAANTPTFTTSTTTSIFGSLTLISGMTLTASTSTYTFEGRGSFMLTNAGKTWAKSITLNAPGGTLTLQDAFTAGATNTLNITRGAFDANNQNVTVGLFSSSNTNNRTITMGSGTWTLTGTGTVWSMATTGTGLTLSANTSSIVINNSSVNAKTFAGGGKIFYNLQFTNTGTGSLTISGSNTFNNLTIDTQPKSVNFTAGTTQTINGIFAATGSAGALITLRSTSTPTKWTISAASASVSYVDVMDSTGSGAASPFSCGATCINSGNNTGWTF